MNGIGEGQLARLLGDDTAWRLGRVTFNPLKHIDPFGTILLPGLLLLLHSPFLFGYAKPVPINFRALHNPRRDMVLAAAAGPALSRRRCLGAPDWDGAACNAHLGSTISSTSRPPGSWAFNSFSAGMGWVERPEECSMRRREFIAEYLAHSASRNEGSD
jgi:hypothetical protein